jgi:hypothetical protein
MLLIKFRKCCSVLLNELKKNKELGLYEGKSLLKTKKVIGFRETLAQY